MIPTQEHNHAWLVPTDNSLYHPDSDPRKLQDTCPACREMMSEWVESINRMVREGV